MTVGDELTFLGSGLDGSFAAGLATVAGIVQTGFDEVDRAIAEVPLAWFQEVFTMGNAGHSVVVKLPALEEVDAGGGRLRDMLAANKPMASAGLVVLDWDALQPGLRQAIQSDMTSAWFMYGVLILLVAWAGRARLPRKLLPGDSCPEWMIRGW